MFLFKWTSVSSVKQDLFVFYLYVELQFHQNKYSFNLFSCFLWTILMMIFWVLFYICLTFPDKVFLSFLLLNILLYLTCPFVSFINSIFLNMILWSTQHSLFSIIRLILFLCIVIMNKIGPTSTITILWFQLSKMSNAVQHMANSYIYCTVYLKKLRV